MRKNAGFMIMTLLLLIVPALANAWTLTVKVAGGNANNSVAVTYPTSTSFATTATKTVKSGTAYLYPTKAGVTAAIAGSPTITLDGVTYAAANLSALASRNHTLKVVYPADGTSGLTLNQAAGGMIYAQNQNNTWSTTGVSGLAAGTLVPVTIAADNNYKIVSYTIGTAEPTPASGKVVSLSVPANGQAVTALFAVDAKIQASLFAPTNAVAGKAVTLSVTATTNDTGLQYSFSTDGGATFSAPSASASFSFTPTAPSYVVKATVTSAGGGRFTTPAATIAVTSAQVDANSQCVSCHSTQSATIVANYNASVHGLSTHSACASCHTSATPHSAGINALNINTTTFVVTEAVPGAHAEVPAGGVFCAGCHAGSYAAPHVLTGNMVNCNACHTPKGKGDAHTIQPVAETSCVQCHAFAANAGPDFVQDNNGVRAITTEFAKWSHHVTGVALQDAHCAACHLEGKAVDGKIVVDTTKHMADAKTHLRNADTDADMEWDPAAPNHGTMDNFCMSCHDANGATSAASQAIQAVIVPAAGKVASALNPFGDTISNRYDKMLRPSVVDVSGQFDTTNNSHHAVKGARYTGRSRAADVRQIASPATFAQNSSATLYGKRSTIYDAGNFNSLYVPLGTNGTAATSLGDDSTLHCGDCHTVGQWKPGVATNAAGQLNTVAIGAHGSNNEYMLRNTLGTDARHTQNIAADTTATSRAMLVCYNCHAYKNYGSIFGATGATGPHSGEYAQAGRCNGPGNTIPFNGYTTGTATDGTQFESRFEGPISKYSSAAPYAGEQNPDFGNVFGIQCANCHNSGLENGYGGIHGSKVNTYVDGMGNIQKMERFLPGLGNVKYVPGTLGGITGGTVAGPVYNDRNSAANQNYTYTTGGVSNDTNWEQKESKVNANGALEFAGAGCYTLTENAGAATSGVEGLSVNGGASLPEAFGTWGGCDDHGSAQGGANHGIVKKIVRPITY